MDILFITHRRPKIPGKGDQVRAFQQMVSLLKRGHRVHCLFQEKNEAYCYSLSSAKGDMEEQYRLKGNAGYLPLLKGFFLKGYPLSVSLHSFSALTSLLQQLLSCTDYDVIHIQSKLVHNFTTVQPPRSTVVIDYIDAISLHLERRYKRVKNPIEKLAVKGELVRMKKYEAFLKNQEAKAIITSPADKEFLHFGRASQADVVPNYIDLSYFHLNPLIKSKKTALVFTGTMSYAPNVDAAVRLVKDIYQPLKKKLPDLECWIVGTNPSSAVKRLSNISGVTVTGFVEDIREWQWRAAVYVCPLRFGAGQQNKILEAAALGCPIVMSRITNLGIGFADQEEAVICEQDQEFIAQTEKLLADHHLREALGGGARQFVAARFSEEKVANQLIAAYADRVYQLKNKEVEACK
ncbi:glycosyltransferase family 4 protein [Pseudobacillus badius]|uniref:glycosyltransferase family 4 protein n=1 Tax=Bacillus badius TaxID=1455 RepID=UPI0007B3E30B|nr:glycosyltransferase family 4 protein [Bacillus badius]KZR59547.1 hypothetical protein A3781_12295 [Bacillus badius]